MFNNCGNKVKTLAHYAFVLESLAAIITGIGLIASDDDYLAAGIITIIAGIPVAYAFSLLIYTFGDIADRLKNIDINAHPKTQITQKPAPETSKTVAPQKEQTTSPTEPEKVSNFDKISNFDDETTWTCPQCGRRNMFNTCWNCGKKKETSAE